MQLARDKGRLWALIAAPSLWAGHFLVAYWIASVYCAKAGRLAALDPARNLILVITGLTLAVMLGIGWLAWRQHRLGREGRVPHQADTPEDRQRFLGFASLLLCGLSSLAVIYTALVVLFFETCQ